jgi:phenylacetate-coenzyme A ligase PaaK-like adenylate-forming protein
LNTLRKQLKEKVLRLSTQKTPVTGAFEALALEIFQHQYQQNDLYRQYCSLLGKDISKITTVFDIPFLPIQFFKNYVIKTNFEGKSWQEKMIFTSSGTTGAATSQHFVHDLETYLQIARNGFEPFYGKIENYCIIGLLPAYAERTGSSLIAMVDDFVKISKYPQSGFFLYDFKQLISILKENQAREIPTILIGVSFALLDLAEQYPTDLSNIIIMETGGMKGRRAEWTRNELHTYLKNAFKVDEIHSEYGMTELFSQAYSLGKGIFQPAPTLRAYTRDITDPLCLLKTPNRQGVLNLIDLGNFNTISFIATDDLGRIQADGSFEILGRLDYSDIRGCNLLVQ